MTKKIIMTKKELLACPVREWDEKKRYEYFYVVPTRRKHDSGYMWMALVGKCFDGNFEIAAYCDHLTFDFSEVGGQLKDRMVVNNDMDYPIGVIRYYTLSNDFCFQIGISLSTTEVKIVKQA